MDLAAHALNLGEDWRAVLAMDRDEIEDFVESVVWQRAIDLRHERDKSLAAMIANAVNGARSLDGRRDAVVNIYTPWLTATTSP